MRQTNVRQNDTALPPQSRGLRPKLLAVSSGGGHWIQLMRIKHAFEDCSVTFVTVHDSYRNQVAEHNFYVVNDANRWDKIGLLRAGAQACLDNLDREARYRDFYWRGAGLFCTSAWTTDGRANHLA